MLARGARLHTARPPAGRAGLQSGALMLKSADAENPAGGPGRTRGHALPLLRRGAGRAALRRGVPLRHAGRQPPGLLRRGPALPTHAGARRLLRDGARRGLRRAARGLHDLLVLRLADLRAAARRAGGRGRRQRRRVERARGGVGLRGLRGRETVGGRVRGREAEGGVPPILLVLAAALLWSTGGLFIKAAHNL